MYHVSPTPIRPLAHPPYPPQHHHRHHQHKQVFYTTTPLQPKPFTQESLYARSPLLHQKVFTPRTSLHHQHFLSETKAFHTKHLLLPFHFSQTSFCIRSPSRFTFLQPFLAQKQERFTPQTFCTKQFLHHKLFVPHSFVTKNILLHTPLLPEALCITRLLHQKPFAPQYTTMRIQRHFLAWKSQQGYTAPAQPSDAKRINDTLLQRNHDAKRDQNTYITLSYIDPV